MSSILGNFFVISSTICFGLSVFFSSKRIQIKKLMFFLAVIFSFLSFLSLIYAFVTSDFSIKSVFFNSDKNKELFFKIAASWGNNEGSMLFWNFLLSAVFFISFFIGKFSSSQAKIFINISSYLILSYNIFVIFFANPFSRFTIMPLEGMGFNPMLQDKALIIHPPILYIGYSFSLLPFVVSCIIMLDRFCDREYLIFLIKKFTGFAIFFLTFGILLGSWWAYRELGWGDFWFFDPVENISLIPWFMLVALYHFILIAQKIQKYLISCIMISCTIFLLVIYNVFLVRSGVISSVHSFAYSTKSLFLLGIAGISHIIVLVFFCCKKSFFNDLLQHTHKPQIQNNRLFYLLKLGNILMIFASIILIFTILVQLFFALILKNNVSLEQGFFIKVFIPIFIPISLLMIGTYFIKNHKMKFFNKILLLLFSFSLFFYLFLQKGQITILNILNLFASLMLIFSVLVDLLIGKNFSFIIIRYRGLAMFVGHVGFGLFMLALTLNQIFSEELLFEGEVGDIKSVGKIDAKFLNIRIRENKNYFSQIAEFMITTKNILHKKSLILRPEQRFYKVEKQVSSEADIYSFLLEDIYCVIIASKGNKIKAKIFYRPFISFIWISCCFISTSFIINIFKRRA
ncbi:MAG: heme lyase CcmF/NrfE family subunit [Rickettsia sp.]|nr:heme lyase CcmF/NrfE family subunit [Rickettsia sp.]